MSDQAKTARFTRMVWLREQYTTHRKKQRTLMALRQDYEEFRQLVVEFPAALKTDNGILETMHWKIKDEVARISSAARNACPIGWAKPTWEQVQMLNAWSPEYEPHLAPDGYQTFCNFGGVRSLKTTGACWDAILWCIPNNPDWPFFEPYTDHLGREVKLIPRFRWDEWRRCGRICYDDTEPPKEACEFWQGVVDEPHWRDKIEKEYRKWIPDEQIARKEDGTKRWMIADKSFVLLGGSSITAKLYGSTMDAWSGKELFMVLIDEGIPKDKLDEVVVRTEYIRWTYTPREPANTAERAAVAKACYDGEPGFPLVGDKKFFFSKMSQVPDYVADKKKKDRRLKSMSQMGEAGRVAEEGGFMFNAPNVFSHFKREFNILPISGSLVSRAIRGDLSPLELKERPWLELFKDANIFRGYDDGTANHAASVWMALLKTGERVAFRVWKKTGLSISERAQGVIEMSGNKREQFAWNSNHGTPQIHSIRQEYGRYATNDERSEKRGNVRFSHYREIWESEVIRRTYADSKMFVRDPHNPSDIIPDVFRREGLILDKGPNDGPEYRYQQTDNLFAPDHTRLHLCPGQGAKALSIEDDYGCKLYLTNDCPELVWELEHLLNATVKMGGENEVSEKIILKKNHATDALGYVATSRVAWTDPIIYSRSVLHAKAA